MERLKTIFLCALLCYPLCSSIWAQQNGTSTEKQKIYLDETVFIHTNTSTFVTGETLYYKLYCLKLSNKTPSDISKIAYVELIDSDKKIIFKNKLTLENTRAQGDYFIPTTLKTGNYKLIAFTHWMLNQTIKPFFEIDIVIINPFQTTEATNSGTLANSDTRINSSPRQQQILISSENLKLNLEKKTFTNREQVNFKIQALNEISKNGHYSMSIRKLDDLPSKKQITSSEFSASVSKIEMISQNKKLILPELRGEMIIGKITSQRNPNDIQDISIGLSNPGKTFAFKVVKTDKNGNFIFNLDNAYYNSSIIIQVIDDKREDYTISISESSPMDYSKLNIQTNFNLTPENKESLLSRSIASQIENAYYSKKTDSLFKQKSIGAFYEPIAKEYILDDYTRFPTLRETSTEIIKEMYYKEDKKNYSLYLRDPSIYTQSTEPALVLVDGLLIQNTNELFEYKMTNISKISIVPGLYFLGPKVFNGVISFTTINLDYVSSQSGAYILDTIILRPSIKKKYFTADYRNKSKNERIPDYRFQLLWLPDLTFANTENPISFYTSDVTGTFEIVLEGFTYQGTPVSLKETFEVQ